jgi:hypothetical protein
MPGLIETSQVGAREDLSEYIVNIEKTDTPLFTMIPKDTVHKTHFETQVDDYGETDDIAGVGSSEDADDFDNMAENRGLIENYVMKMRETPAVDDFAENVNENPALQEGEYVNSVAKAIVRLKFRIEKLLLSQVQAVVQANGAKYRTCSIGGFLSTSAPTGAQTIPSRFRTPSAHVYTSTLAAYDEDDSHGVLQEIFEATNGAGKFTAIVGSSLKLRYSSMAIYRPTVSNYTAIQHINSQDSKTLEAVVDVLVGDFGTIVLVPSTRVRYFDGDGAATTTAQRRGSGYILDLSMWGLAFKRKPTHRRLEDQDGGPRGIVGAIFGLRAKAPKNNGAVLVSS